LIYSSTLKMEVAISSRNAHKHVQDYIASCPRKQWSSADSEFT
jgi:hypothetical protein